MSIIRNGFESADLDVPVTAPTLNLDFANSQSLDSRITFTRGSIGTRVNKNGLIETIPANQPRFDYDPISGECKGLLIEESRTNLFLYSEDFSNGIWSKSNVSVSTNTTITTAPDGSNAADLLIESTTNSQHNTSQVFTIADNTTCTFSVYVKAKERTSCRISIRTKDNVFPGAYFNLITGTVTSTISSPTSVSIVSAGNGWYRCSVTANSNTGATSPLGLIYIVSGTSTLTYQGDGTSGIYVWGAQVEAGAFPTSYIPTSASTVTRSADNASMTGTNFSSWYNQTESTILCNFNAYNLMSTVIRNVLQIGGPEPSGVNRIQLQLNGSGGGGTTQPIYHNLYQNGPNFADYFGFTYRTGLTKNIMRYKDMDTFVAVSDGRIRRNTTSRILTVPLTKTMNNLSFGGFNGAISKFAYYPKALNDAEIQYLTQ